MSTFSPSDAALEGFTVIRRHWRVVVGWAAFNLLALVAMVVLTVVIAVPLTLASSGAGADTSSQLVAGIGGAVAALGYLVVQVVITTGLFRLLLRPGEPGFLHLRLGGTELKVLAAGLLVFVACVPVLALGSYAAGLGARASGWAGLAISALTLVAAWMVALRLGLAPVQTFADERIRLLAAWRATRGLTWSLVGMSVLALCLVALIALVTWIVLFVLGGVMTGFHDLGLTGPDSLEAHPGRYLFQIVAEMLITPFFLVIVQAPWVAVYRALTPEAAPAEAFA